MDYTTDPCLFPVYNPFSVEDYSTEPSSYPAQTALQPTVAASKKRRIDAVTNSPPLSPMKRQATLSRSMAGQVILQPTVQSGTASHGGYQPVKISIAQLKLNRAAAQDLLAQGQQSRTGDPYPPSDLVQSAWSQYGVNPSVDFDAHTARLLFHTVQEKPLQEADKLVLLHKLRYSNPQVELDLLNRSHLLYRVDTILGTEVSLTFEEMLHTPPHNPQDAGYFPLTVSLIIDHEYILLEGQRAAALSPSNTPDILTPLAPSTQPRGRRDNGMARSSGWHYDVDEISEDSDAWKHSKKSIIELDGECFEIYGKPVIHENLKNRLVYGV